MRPWWCSYVFSLVFAASAFAADPQTYPPKGVQVFLGLDDTSAPTQVQDGRAQDLQNVLLDGGALLKRHGIKVIGDTCDIPDEAFAAVTGLYYTKFSSGTERIVRTCGARFEYLNGSDWQTINGATITAGQNNQFVFATALDNIIATNDVDKPLQYNGTSATPVLFSGLSAANLPTKAKAVAFFKNYLIFANTVENGVEYPTRFRYSNVGTINTWSNDDYVDIGALGGQEINALVELYDNLYVFLTDSIYKISLVGGNDIFQVSKVTDDIGCIAKNSVQTITLTNAQNGIIFLDKDKRVYFFNGVIAQDISQLITETMDGLGGSRLQYAVSAQDDSDYFLCATNSTGATNDLCLDLQYQMGEWTKHTNIPANAMATVIDSNTTEQIYFGSYKSLTYQLQDESLRDDVGTATGTFDTVGTYTTTTASGLQILYDTGLSLTAGALTGAPIELVGGTGSGQTNMVAYNTTTGLVVTNAFSTTPDSSTSYEVGAIDAYYTTKWYDFGDPARLKHWLDVYFWAEADVSSTHSLSWADDYSTDISTKSSSLSSSSSDAIWGSAIWGTALWGDVSDIFRVEPISGEGRYLRLKWADDDPSEVFNIYGWSLFYRPGDLN